MTVVGVLHPGEMGAAVAGALRGHGETVLWAAAGRSRATGERAQAAGLEDAGDVGELCRRCEILLSICPPHAAVDVARAASGFTGLYVDANAIAPDTARVIAELHPRFVDGGIVGPPPHEPGTTRLYLSGGEAETIGALFGGTSLDTRIVSTEPGAASALKAAYAGWTKGSAALLLTVRELARSAHRKGWRWIGEMEEIAQSMAAHDLPTGFHEAAAEVFRRTAEPGS